MTSTIPTTIGIKMSQNILKTIGSPFINSDRIQTYKDYYDGNKPYHKMRLTVLNDPDY